MEASTTWADFQQACEQERPRGLIVLGSGLAEVASSFEVVQTISFGAIPGLVAPTVVGHKGAVQRGRWAGVPMLVSLGRVHGYEGHPIERVTRVVNLAADVGGRAVILTNAAGGIRDDLRPGALMPITGHLTLLNREAWRNPEPVRNLYETGWNTEGVPGIYAALTGPCYETPAEIRALRTMGADAVGMSTAREAEAALARGLKVYGISCITNAAAGLGEGALSHAEVELNAKLAVTRLREWLTLIVKQL